MRGHCKVVTVCSTCLYMCQLLLSVWPLQSGHRVQQLSVLVSDMGQLIWPASLSLLAALKRPLLPLLSRGCYKPCPRPYFSLACGPSCCGAVCGLPLRCSRWALAFSWSPFVPLSFFRVGLMDSPLSSLLHPFASLRFLCSVAACKPCNTPLLLLLLQQHQAQG